MLCLLSRAPLLLFVLPILSCPVASGRRVVSNTSTHRDPSCSAKANPDCNQLAGNCCPHDDGTWLTCCGSQHTPMPSGSGTESPASKSEEGKGGPQKLTFYTYRATHGNMNATAVARWSFGLAAMSANMANAPGVLRYVHNEIIGKDVTPSVVPPECERKFGIDRIIRYKVTMKNTQEVYNVMQGQFAPFVALDNEKCTVPNCQEMWDTYGYVVGCQNGDHDYPGSKWYSFPGACPSMPTGEKTWMCMFRDKGGSCPIVLGTKTCTFKYSWAGEVMLDDLVGIKDYKEFCENGGREFNGPGSSDEGVTIDFWKEYHKPERNQERTEALLRAFADKYRGYDKLEEPPCDSFR